MVDNIDADNGRAVEPGEGVLPRPGSGEVRGEVPPEVLPIGSPPNDTPELVGELVLNDDEQRNADLFSRWRKRFHDIPDERFNRVVEALRVPESIGSITRGLVQEGYCAHLNPESIRLYLAKFRNAMGWPRYMDQFAEPEQEEKEDEAEQLIEEAPVMKRLAWLIRVQSARVRKALNFEGQMAGMVLPMASSEIKLLSDLLDREIEVALKTGEVKTPPQKVEVATSIPGGLDMASAFRVVLAAKKVRAILAAEEPEVKEKVGLIKDIKQRLPSLPERNVLDQIVSEWSGEKTSP